MQNPLGYIQEENASLTCIRTFIVCPHCKRQIDIKKFQVEVDLAEIKNKPNQPEAKREE